MCILGLKGLSLIAFFQLDVNVWDGQFSKPHCFSGQLCFSTTGVK